MSEITADIVRELSATISSLPWKSIPFGKDIRIAMAEGKTEVQVPLLFPASAEEIDQVEKLGFVAKAITTVEVEDDEEYLLSDIVISWGN